MRLKKEIKTYIIKSAKEHFPNTDIYLFGSRTNDRLKGGDIDLLLLSDNKIQTEQIRRFRIQFFKNFGWQKLDLVCYNKTEKNTFKEIALEQAIILNYGQQTQ